MTRLIWSAVAAAICVAAPTAAHADQGLKYENLVHCAATNIVVASLLSLENGETKNKTDIEAYRNQAAALMLVATVGEKQEPKVMQADVSAETTKLIELLNDKARSSVFIQHDVPACNDLGKAAAKVVSEAKSGR